MPQTGAPMTLDPHGAFVDRVASPTSSSGPLAGMRVAVKDNIAVAGLLWTCGLPLLSGRVAPDDAPCVAALREAGAAIVGTVATDAAGFGMMTPGVINPLAPDRTCGGSSGGSAAAVAAGYADAALGTDTAGSVRVPAACTGLYGLKPTYGSVSVQDVTPLSHTFDHVGVIAGDIDALERVSRVLIPRSFQSAPGSGPTRIGFDAARLAALDDEPIRVAIERALTFLAAEGMTLVEVDLPDRFALAEMHGAIVCAEALEIWRPHWPRDAALFGDTARRSLAYAASLPDDVVAAARAELPAQRAAVARAFDEADAIVGPALAVPPPRVGARRVRFGGIDVPVVMALLAETCPFNVSGNPALSLPLPWPSVDGIPVSLQIAVRHHGEAQALDLARRLAAMPIV
jgi:Asp-tRNA(Asn)/Glu-tRNA(Gln) amidotransferase A subunit family amidase